MLSHLSTGDNVRQWVSKLSEIIPHFLFQQWWLEQLLEKVSVLRLHKRTGNFGWTVNGEIILVCPAEKISKINTTSGACTICKEKTVVPLGWQMERFIPTEFFRKKVCLPRYYLLSLLQKRQKFSVVLFALLVPPVQAELPVRPPSLFLPRPSRHSVKASNGTAHSLKPVFTLTAKNLEYGERGEGLSTGSCFISCHYLYLLLFIILEGEHWR